MYVNLKRSIENSEAKWNEDSRNESFSRKHIENLKRILIERSKDYSSTEELKVALYEELIELSVQYVSVSSLAMLYYEYTIGKGLTSSPSEIRNLFLEVRDKDDIKHTAVYSVDSEVAKREYMANVLMLAVNNNLNVNSDVIDKMNKTMIKHIGKQVKDKIIQSLEITGRLFDRFNLFGIYKSAYDDILSDISVPREARLKILSDNNLTMDEYDLLTSPYTYKRTRDELWAEKKLTNEQFEKISDAMNLSRTMSYEVSTGEYSRENLGLKELFDKRFLEQLDIDELVLMLVSWQNHFAKDCDNINRALMLADMVDLSGDTRDIPEEELKRAFLKTNFLDEISRKMMIFAKGLGSENFIMKDGYMQVNIDILLDEIEPQVFADYEREFGTSLKGDIYSAISLFNIKNNMYTNKNDMILLLINNFTNNCRIKNWGYIEEKEYTNSRKIDKGKVVIGFDSEGYNLPARWHVDKKLIIERFKSTKKEPILPDYEGNSDFVDHNGRLINAPIFMPLTKRQKSALKMVTEAMKATSKDKRKINIYEHLLFLADSDKFPEHLSCQVVRGKKVTYKRKPRQYTNIKSGEKLIKGKNGYESFSGR